MSTKIKAIISVLVFILLLGGAYYAYNSLSERYKPQPELNITESENEQKEIAKDSENAEGESDQGEEKISAPDFTVLDAAGNPVKLSDFFGKPIVLNFWASWCPPCKHEMPYFDKVYKEVKDEVVFMMVDMVDGQRETIEKGQKYIDDSGYSFPVYFDYYNERQEAAYTYGISSIPSTLFIDKNGNIVVGYQGAIDEKVLLDGINLIRE